ncbi:MAG: hypothetical protein IPP77_10665 [Bacteroidetes bacterium]|nr:hypothetical protein [Bacteroidota bacterium]
MNSSVSEKIFDIFRKHRIPANGVLYPRHISASVHLWEEESQQSFEEEMSGLVQQGYVNVDDDTYRLTALGYEYLYRHYSLADTIEIILADFRKRRIDKNDILLLPALLATLQNEDRYHFDQYDKAIRCLVEKDWLIANGRGFILTNEGYREVYPE